MSELLADDEFRADQVEELGEQRRRFDEQRQRIEDEFDQAAVGFVSKQDAPLVAPDIQSLLDEKMARFPDAMMYFEPVGYRGF